MLSMRHRRLIHRGGLEIPEVRVVGVDFVLEMIKAGKEKVEKKDLSEKITLMHGDALALPSQDNSFDVTGMAFGIRNIPDRKQALQEMLRVTMPGGQVMILEMTFMRNRLFRILYYVYLNYLLPPLRESVFYKSRRLLLSGRLHHEFPHSRGIRKNNGRNGHDRCQEIPPHLRYYLAPHRKRNRSRPYNEHANYYGLGASQPPSFLRGNLHPSFDRMDNGNEEYGHGTALAIYSRFLGSLTVHLITNLANDYFDHMGGTDAGQALGGSRVIQEGKITPKNNVQGHCQSLCLRFAIAFVIIFGLELYLLAIPIFFAAFSSYFYVAPPIRYGYHGLGELFVGINMGPIMVVGTYWVITGHPGWTPFLISIPVGLMVALILYYQSLPDMITDAAVNKIPSP